MVASPMVSVPDGRISHGVGSLWSQPPWCRMCEDGWTRSPHLPHIRERGRSHVSSTSLVRTRAVRHEHKGFAGHKSSQLVRRVVAPSWQLGGDAPLLYRSLTPIITTNICPHPPPLHPVTTTTTTNTSGAGRIFTVRASIGFRTSNISSSAHPSAHQIRRVPH
eukprot:gene14730-biopygen18660